MNAPLIIDRIRAVNDDAQEMRILMLDVEAFEIAKQVADAPRASRDLRAPTVFRGSKASLSIVLDGCSIEVVVDLATRTGRVMSNERAVAA